MLQKKYELTPRELGNINPINNTIICVADNNLLNISKRNTIQITTKRVNLGGPVEHGCIRIEQKIPIKISTPVGINISFENNIENDYLRKIYINPNILQVYDDENEIELKNLIYTSPLLLTALVDINQLKTVNKTVNIDNGTPLFELDIHSNSFMLFDDNIHIIVNSEIFRNFENIF